MCSHGGHSVNIRSSSRCDFFKISNLLFTLNPRPRVTERESVLYEMVNSLPAEKSLNKIPFINDVRFWI